MTTGALTAKAAKIRKAREGEKIDRHAVCVERWIGDDRRIAHGAEHVKFFASSVLPEPL